MELSLPVITTYICCDWESNTQPFACEVSTLTDCATATTAVDEFQAINETIVICYFWVVIVCYILCYRGVGYDGARLGGSRDRSRA